MVRANAWIASLNAEDSGAGHLGYNDWRLPETNPVNGISYDYAGSCLPARHVFLADSLNQNV